MVENTNDFFFKDFIYLFEGEGEGEKHQCVVASHAPPTGDQAWNPGMCPDWETNQPPFGLQASTQSTEPHQPGPNDLWQYEKNITRKEKLFIKYIFLGH